MNFIDKMIMAIDPLKGLKRYEARKKLEILNTGYSNHGASTTKKSMVGWQSTGGGVKKDIYKNRKKLVERSRDLYMGVSVATGALKTINTNVIGSGLKLKSDIDSEIIGISEEEAEKIENLIEKEFRLWSKDKIDNLGTMNFYQLQDLVFLTVLMNGECFIKLNYFETPKNPYSLKLEILEPDRIYTPNNMLSNKSVVEGVKIDKNGRIEGYYISSEHPLDATSGVTEKLINVYGSQNQRNIIHLLFTERPEQVRGIPILAPVIEDLRQLGNYTEAELMAAVISGMYAIFIESDADNSTAADVGELEAVDNDLLVDSNDETTIELAPGMIASLNPGEKAKETNPGRPNSNFDPFVTSILRQVGSALEVPYELLIKHFTASYSASRAALLEAWKMFRKRREWFTENFIQPVYEEWLNEAYLLGRVELKNYGSDFLIDKAWSGSQWNGPSQGQIDPLKEANAAVIRINNGLSTRTRETAELNGGDFEQNARLLAKENKSLTEKGVIVNGQTVEILERDEE